MIEQFLHDVQVIQKLSDMPNQEGLSAEDLKKKFDEAPEAIKEYINNQLVPSVQALQKALNSGEGFALDDTLSVSGRAAEARATGEAIGKVAKDSEAALLTRAEGRSSNYRLSSGGWKRIFIGIRGHSGTINLSLGCNNALGHMVQNIALGYSMYVDWPASRISGMAGQGTYPGGGPKVWQISNHCFGEDPAQVDLNQVYRIDKVRIAYPLNWDTTADADTGGRYQNPVNCYLDIHVAGNVRLHNDAPLVQLMANIIGKSDNHGTYAIIEETDAPVDAEGYVLGSLGEKCQTVEFMLHEDSGYSVDEPSRFKELLTEKTYQLTEKSITTDHFVNDDLYDVKRLTIPVVAANVSKIGIRASRKVNMVPGRTEKFGTKNGVEVEQVGNGIFRLTGTATGAAIAKIYEYTAGDVPIVLKKGVTYYASGIQLYYNTPETAGLDPNSDEFKAGRLSVAGYTDGKCLSTSAKPITPTSDRYVTRISVYINKGNVYDGYLYYPQLTTDVGAIVSDLQTGDIRAKYDAYVAEQNALGKLPLHYISWLDRKLGADRYSPEALWVDAGGVQTDLAYLDFTESQAELWDGTTGETAVMEDPYIALYRREITRAGALSIAIEDTDGNCSLLDNDCTIEGTVKGEAVAMSFRESAEHSGCYYRMVDGEVEWQNPPMIPDVEYRTTERWLGSPVYTKVINWGYMPNKAYEGRECGVDATKIIEIRAYAHYVSNNSKQVFPLHSLAGGGITAVCWAEGIKIFIQTFYDESHGTAYVIIKYTKD